VIYSLVYHVAILAFVSLINVQDPSQTKLRSLLSDVELSPDDTTKVNLYIEISNEYLSTNNSASIEFAQRALSLAEQLQFQSTIDKALHQITLTTFNAGLNEIAAQYMLRKLNSSIERKDYLEIGRAYFNLGSLKHILGDLQEAEAYFMKGWRMIDSVYTAQGQTYPKNELATIYNNLAYLKWSMDQLEESEKYYSQGLAIGTIEEITSRNYINLNTGIVNVLFKKKEYGNIQPRLKSIIEYQKQENDLAGLVISYRLEGDLFGALYQHEKAIRSYMMAWSLSNKVENVSTSQYVANALHTAYENIGNADSALKYLNISSDLSKQMKANEARQELLKAELAREFSAREATLQMAARDASRRFTIIIIVISALSFFSIWLFIYFRKRYISAESKNLEIMDRAQQSELEAKSLKSDLERKDKELTTQVIYSIQKNEMINDVVEKLQNKSTEELLSQESEIKKIIKTLEKTRDQSVWEEFELRFQQVHSGFYDRIQDAYPNLSLNERRLCAFLRLDMTTKEIAAITGQTTRAVEMARIRLRKKMNLTKTDTSLFEVLSSM